MQQTTVCRKGERVFIVSIRKDVDDHSFKFPTAIPLELCMGDFLDAKVPAEFYLSDEQLSNIKSSAFNQERTRIQDRGGACVQHC